ncbi:site-specific integrase [Rhizobium ruizarguesonis]|uniref:hypothetical protein n=1 Tax=Rhizobium ruizarguesonis TaxID=2081791 RepID=UPI001031A107|nr:hypothetical protein [Rhizobium ruizarguesonis]NEI29660.1 hypothetical protein [Rhizobium ruizarguesonis]TBB91901.1 hypothetical protein ELH38_07310 [Rhizobium ruizarguesonis]
MSEMDVVAPIIRIRAIEIEAHEGRIETTSETSKFPPGFILLFEAVSGNPLTLFNEFTREVAVAGRTNFEKWRNTQEAYADDGANYATYLHYQGKSLERGTFLDLKKYAALLNEAISSQTGRRFEDQTRRRRVGTIVAFYEHAFDKGSLPQVIPPRAGSLPPGLKYKSERPKSDRRVRDLMPNRPGPGEKINLVPIAVLQKALSHLGPRIDQRLPGGPHTRDRLVCESGVLTGARLVSLMSVKTIDVLNAERRIDPRDPNQLLSIPARSKGNAPATILVSQALLRKWLIYYRGERAEVCRRVVERFGRDRRISENLFLNHATSNDRDLGNAASEDTVSRAFTRALTEINHTTLQQRAVLNEEGVPLVDSKGRVLWSQVQVAANTFHDLRHTFVVMTYHAMKRGGNRNPWKVISLALGHKLLSTTIDTYGKHVEIDESMLSDAVSDVLFELDL